MKDESDAIARYLFGEADSKTGDASRERLAEDPAVAQEAEDLAGVLELYRSTEWSEVPPPGLRRLAVGEASRRRVPWLRRLTRAFRGPIPGLVTVGAVACVVAAVGWDLSRLDRVQDRRRIVCIRQARKSA